MSTEAMKLALEALEESLGYVEEEAENAQRLYGQYPTRQARIQGLKDDVRKHMKAITALREALAEQPAQQEPVLMFYEHEWQGKTSRAYQWLIDPFSLPEGTKLYTSPPAQQEPVEYWTVANGWVSDQAEVPAAVWVEPDFWEHCNRVNCGTAYRLPAPGRQPLYTSPPAQRKPLTDEEIGKAFDNREIGLSVFGCFLAGVHFAEAAHNIKEST